MHSPMIRMNADTSGQPQAIAAGPPLFQPRPNEVKQPARMEMIEKEMAKFEKPDQERLSSCLYPSDAKCFSSSLSSGAVMAGPPAVLSSGVGVVRVRWPRPIGPPVPASR